VLVICDRFTKLPRAIPLQEATALMVSSAFVSSAFVDTCVAAYGMSDSVLTDNAPLFSSVYYRGILGLLDMASNYTFPSHPQTNGQVERYNFTLVRQLRCCVAQRQTEWDSHLSLLTTAYKTQVQASTWEFPFAVLSPRRLQLIGMERLLRLGQAEERTESASTAVKKYDGALKAFIPAACLQLGKLQATYKRTLDARTKETDNAVKAGKWAYSHCALMCLHMDAHSRFINKLAFNTQAPDKVLQTLGPRFVGDSVPD